MIGLVVALVALPIPGVAGAVAPAPATLEPDAVLALALPRLLPCRRFETVELLADDLPGEESPAEPPAIAWQAGGRDWQVTASAWHPPPAPLGERALPRQVQLLVAVPVATLELSFYCRRYELTFSDELHHDSDPFVGVRWSCKPGGCQTMAGYPLAAQVARSPRRLRLCAKSTSARDGSDCNARHRNIEPAFENQGRALALGRDILADAQRTLADACAAAHGCSPRATILARSMRPGRWRVTSFSGLPVGFKLSADDADRAMLLDCSARADGGNVICDLKILGADRQLLFDYLPINDEDVPEAFLTVDGVGWIELHAELPDADNTHDVGSGCEVSGALLSTR